MRWHGYLRAPKPGKYNLRLSSDDGSRLFLDGKPLMDRMNGAGSVDVEVELTDKPHLIRVEFADEQVVGACTLSWSREGKPSFAWQPIGPQFLFHTREQERVNTEGK